MQTFAHYHELYFHRLIGCGILTPAVLLCMAQPALAAEPPTEPQLRIETGMHTATFMRIAVDRENRYLVTGSPDKTIRVWELPAGELLRVLRPPIREGHEGKINAVAISPDSWTIAAGGWTGYDWDGSTSIYLFDRVSGKLAKRLTGLPETIQHLAYSPDGRWLVATLSGANGIRVYRTADRPADYELIAEDSSYGGDSFGADFDRDNRLVTTSIDGLIRLYAPMPPPEQTLKPLKTVKAPGGKHPHGVSFSPDGTRIAVGYDDFAKVDVLSADDLHLLYSPDTSDVGKGNLLTVAWSVDGQRLYAAGGYQKQEQGKWHFPIRVWTEEGRGPARDVAAAVSTIMGLKPLASGGMVYGSGEPGFGLLDAGGKRTRLGSPATADVRNNEEGLLVSRDGSTVQFGYDLYGQSPARFSVQTRTLELDPAAIPDLTKPHTEEGPGLKIEDWIDNEHPLLNGQPLELILGDPSRSLAIAPDGQQFVLGSEWHLRCFNRAGKPCWPGLVPVPGIAWAVNISGDGRVVVAALGDGTIRWYRMEDGRELLALFPHADRRRWVLWTPSGYYAASIGGEELIGWRINRGKEQAGDFFPVWQFRDTYYRPDVVAKVLQTHDGPEALRLANAEAGRTQPVADITEQLPPVVRLAGKSEVIETKSDTITVRVTVHSSSGAPVTKFRVFIDGSEAPLAKGPPPISDQPAQEQERELVVPVPARDATVTIRAENEFGTSEPVTLAVKWTGRAVAEEMPDLYVLAVGVNYTTKDGKRTDFSLDYAEADAEAFVETMKGQKGRRYRDVHWQLVTKKVVRDGKSLTDDKTMHDAILTGLTWLKTSLVKPTDVGMLFLSGHGLNEGERYYFLPDGADRNKLLTTAIPGVLIAETIGQLRGTKLVFVDTCRSGNVDIVRLASEMARPKSGEGAVIFTSSTGTQVSLEHKDWKHGAFTKALIEGLKGNADVLKTGQITVNGLDSYVTAEVKRLTGKRQTPTSDKPGTVPSDFLVAK